MKSYPSCFPKNFTTDILPDSIHMEDKFVYRVMKKGFIDREGFISTCEEVVRGLRPHNWRDDPADPSYYSTSCNEELKDAMRVVSLLSGNHPKSIVVQGVIKANECGPWQLTEERTGKKEDSHIDWWVYEDSNPEKYFSEISENEER